MKSNRRIFIKQSAMAGMVLGLQSASKLFPNPKNELLKIGIIGLDTTHSIAFTEILNSENKEEQFSGVKVVAAYPFGSRDIKSSLELIAPNIEKIKGMGVKIVDSIQMLLKKVDAVLLETNDGRLHLEQAKEVISSGKPLFIDKPVSASLQDAINIFNEAMKKKAPVFSSSSLRYLTNAQAVRNENKIGQVLGADTYSPATLEPHHPDFFWYGIHGVEALYTVLGTGCDTVSRFNKEDSDIIVGVWKDGRMGTVRGMRKGAHDYGGIAFGTEGNINLGPFDGFKPLLVKVAEFFKTGISPVDYHETLEIYGFMEAADVSKRKNGRPVSVLDIMEKAGYKI